MNIGNNNGRNRTSQTCDDNGRLLSGQHLCQSGQRICDRSFRDPISYENNQCGHERCNWKPHNVQKIVDQIKIYQAARANAEPAANPPLIRRVTEVRPATPGPPAIRIEFLHVHAAEIVPAIHLPVWAQSLCQSCKMLSVCLLILTLWLFSARRLQYSAAL